MFRLVERSMEITCSTFDGRNIAGWLVNLHGLTRVPGRWLCEPPPPFADAPATLIGI